MSPPNRTATACSSFPSLPAARELSDALVINPYDTDQFADAIRYAVEMDPDERQTRMARMRQVVEEHNVYWWAASFLTELAATRSGDSRSTGSFSFSKQLAAMGVKH